eukprot:TRINITY_DN10893_c0_g1_i1.p1 TRINITY_DN10893_c0_g1~~TRINITY_DN10893_c0_g1_i1.p1  ORF type:complete len:114 (+),score=12.68 TRINITY_DN10893_c0_g1_i1:78-419(+)
MGCCHSNVPSREEELPPKRQEDRNQRDHASASNDLLGDGAGETVQGDLLPYGQEDGVKDDDKYAVDDALDQLLANGWRYFIVDSVCTPPGVFDHVFHELSLRRTAIRLNTIDY